MKKSVQLKQKRTAIVRSQEALYKKAETENREFTPEEQAELEKTDGEIEDLNKQIETAEKNEEREDRFVAARGASVGTGFHGAGPSNSELREIDKVVERVSLVSVLRGLSAQGGLKMEGAVKELHEIGMEANRTAGVTTPENTAFAIPLAAVTRATQQTVSQDSGQYGGELVQDQGLRMVDNLRPNLFLEALGSTFFMDLKGGDLPLITSDAFAMNYMGEVDTITIQKQKFGGKKLSPKRTAGAVDLSNRLLMQSSPDVEAWIRNQMVNALGVTVQSAAINGSGTGDTPTGLLQMTGINLADDVAATVADWVRLIELQGLVEEDDAGNSTLGYLIHPKVKAALKAIKKDEGSGLFLFENGAIDDIKTISSSLVPLLTTVYPIIYGDWKELFMGQWGALNIQVDPYSANLSGATRFVFNTYTDATVVNEKAFAVNKWIKGSTT